MSNRRWLRLQGTRYRCVPMYLPLEEFDPIARLFLEILNYERSLPRLVQAFGLTPRVVEDVLGDLIRRNRAALVIQTDVKEIRLLEDSVPNLVYERGEPLDLWQENATGIVLPAWVVDPYDRPRGDENDEPFLGINLRHPLVAKFTRAPDSQLIDMIIRSDDSLRQRGEAYGQLDRLGDKYRVRPQTVWLPVIDAELQGRSIPLIETERIPPWVLRVWTLALKKDSFQHPSEFLQLHIMATTAEEGFRIVNSWRGVTLVEQWREAVDRFLNIVPAPISGYDLHEVRECEAAVASAFLSIGQIELLDPPPKNNEADWVTPVFESSQNWVILVLARPGQVESLLEWLRQKKDAKKNLPSSLIIVCPAGTLDADYREKLRILFGPSRFSTIIQRDWPASGPSVALGDGAEVRVSYASRSPLIRFASESLASGWLGIVQALPVASRDPSTSEDFHDEPVRDLRIRRETLSTNDDARLGASVDAREVTVVVDELRGFGESLLTAVVDPVVLMSEAATPESDLSPAAMKFDKERSLLHQLPILSEQCDALRYQLSLSPSAPWVFWSRLTSDELTPALVAILTEPNRRSVAGEIHLLASNVSQDTLGIQGLLHSGVCGHGWVINLGLPKANSKVRSEERNDILSSLRQQVASPRLRFWSLRRPPPAHALVIDDLVFIAGGDLLRPTVDPQYASTDFGFAIESREFATSLRTCFIGAEEIVRYSDDK